MPTYNFQYRTGQPRWWGELNAFGGGREEIGSGGKTDGYRNFNSMATVTATKMTTATVTTSTAVTTMAATVARETAVTTTETTVARATAVTTTASTVTKARRRRRLWRKRDDGDCG
jgi:hypothetical protein